MATTGLEEAVVADTGVGNGHGTGGKGHGTNEAVYGLIPDALDVGGSGLIMIFVGVDILASGFGTGNELGFTSGRISRCAAVLAFADANLLVPVFAIREDGGAAFDIRLVNSDPASAFLIRAICGCGGSVLMRVCG